MKIYWKIILVVSTILTLTNLTGEVMDGNCFSFSQINDNRGGQIQMNGFCSQKNWFLSMKLNKMAYTAKDPRPPPMAFSVPNRNVLYLRETKL